MLFSQINWVYQSIETNRDLISVFFINPNTGWVATYDAVYKTTDKGISFNQKLNFAFSKDADVYFINHNLGFVSQGYTIWKTTNGGDNWNSQTPFSSQVDSWKNTIKFANSGTGYAAYSINGSLNLYKTTNSGESWYLTPRVQGWCTHSYLWVL